MYGKLGTGKSKRHILLYGATILIWLLAYCLILVKGSNPHGEHFEKTDYLRCYLPYLNCLHYNDNLYFNIFRLDQIQYLCIRFIKYTTCNSVSEQNWRYHHSGNSWDNDSSFLRKLRLTWKEWTLGAIHKGRPQIFAQFWPPLARMCPNFQTPSPRTSAFFWKINIIE